MGQRSGHNHHHTGSTNQLGPLQHPTVRADKPPSLHPTAQPVPCSRYRGTTSVPPWLRLVYVSTSSRNGRASLRQILDYVPPTSRLPPVLHYLRYLSTVSTALQPLPFASPAPPVYLAQAHNHPSPAPLVAVRTRPCVYTMRTASMRLQHLPRPSVYEWMFTPHHHQYASPSGTPTPCGITPTRQPSTILSRVSTVV